jgi:hypothetical protein
MRWEYTIMSYPTENPNPAVGWIAATGTELERNGDAGWEAVTILKRDASYSHLLMKRPKES